MTEQLRILVMAGTSAAALAALAWVGDWRRQRRKNPDRVGFMPWTMLFFLGLIAALVFSGLAVRAWLAG